MDQKAVNKIDLIEELGIRHGMGRAKAKKAVDAILGGIVGAIREGQRVEIRNFGVFATRKQSPRLFRNPKTGEKIQKEATRKIYFCMGKQMFDVVNKPRGNHERN